MFDFIQVKPNNKEFPWVGLLAQGLIRGWAYAPDFRVLKSNNATMPNHVYGCMDVTLSLFIENVVKNFKNSNFKNLRKSRRANYSLFLLVN